MKKSILTAALLFGLVTFFMTSCGPDDGGTTTTPTPAKTVDKTKLVNGGWYSKGGGAYTHRFYSNGKYNDTGGTWEWLNNSDSMKVVTSSIDNLTLTAHFVYITDTEMAFKTGSTTAATEVFKSAPW
jgi:hypothetical protein